MTCLRRYLFWCAHEHVDFRIPEFEAIASMFKIKLNFVEKSEKPWVMIDLESEDQAKQILSRSIATRYCVELWAQSGSREGLHAELKQYVKTKGESLRDLFKKDFKVHTEAFMKKFTLPEKMERIESFQYLPIEGKVSLDNPEVVFSALEFYGFDHNNLPDEPFQLFFGRLVGEGQRQLIKKYSLKTRLFIGNTSMDPQLSFLMANLAKVNEGRLVLDPFCGTGGILLASAQFGGYVMGNDIDYMTVHARSRPSRKNQSKRLKGESMIGNFDQYGVRNRYLGVMVADNSRPFYKNNLGQVFQAIITDPPYGLREPTEKVGTMADKDERIPEEFLELHFPKKVKYTLADLYIDLLAFSARHLTKGGRLVFWIPVNREHYARNIDNKPTNPCFDVVADCEQVLNSHSSRRCIVYEKVRDPEAIDPAELLKANERIREITQSFRDNFFKYVDMSREERRNRVKEFGHLNLETTEKS